MRIRRSSSLLVAALLALGFGLDAPASAADPPLVEPEERARIGRAPDAGAGPEAGPSVDPTISGPAAYAIDTSDRAAVRTAYRTRLARGLRTPIRWTGDNETCRAGTVARRGQRAVKTAVNFYRAMGQLPPIRFDAALSAKDQQAALIMSANEALSHGPDSSWRCWTAAGAEAASRSNISLFWGFDYGAAFPIVLYMQDAGSNNVTVGHRRWIMYPWTTTMGSGSTSTSNALWVVGPTNRNIVAPRWTSWPTPGWFPEELEPSGRWSLTANDPSTDFSRARVIVRDPAGRRLSVRTYPSPANTGFAWSPTLVFEVSGVRRTGRRARVYTVQVSNILQPGKPPMTRTYRVRLFDAD